MSHVCGGFSQMGGDEPGGEDTGIPDEAWPSHEPTSPFIKNTTRNLQFNESHFIASPDAPDGVTTYVMHDGHSRAHQDKAGTSGRLLVEHTMISRPLPETDSSALRDACERFGKLLLKIHVRRIQ